jgi:hypothetical protein
VTGGGTDAVQGFNAAALGVPARAGNGIDTQIVDTQIVDTQVVEMPATTIVAAA